MPQAFRLSSRTIALLMPLLLIGGCYMQDWLRFFDFTVAKDAYRVRDLRVLSIRAEPAGLLVDPRVLGGQPDETLPGVDLAVVVDAFDPRGGAVAATISLCSGEEVRDGYSAYSVDLVQEPEGMTVAELVRGCAEVGVRSGELRGVAAPTTEDPFGPVTGLAAHFHLRPSDLRMLASAVPSGLQDWTGATLYIVAEVTRTIEGTLESETALLPMELRRDATHPTLDEQERAAVLEELGAERFCDEELLDDCVWPLTPNESPPVSSVGVNVTWYSPTGAANEAEIRLGDELTLPAAASSRPLELVPLLSEDALERYQVGERVYGASDGGREDGEGELRLRVRREEACVLFYTAGEVGELRTGFDAYDATRCQDVGSYVAYWPGAVTRGDRHVLRLTVSDARGGMTGGTFTLRFE